MDSMKKKIAYLLLLLMLIPVGSFAKEKRTFEIKDGHFYVNGKVTPILSGEMHYPRIPHQYWRHRLRMMRAMGLNTVATYVFWNLHETEPGKWDFEGDKNLAEYIRIAGDPPSRPLRMRRVGVRRLSVVVAEYTGHGDPPG